MKKLLSTLVLLTFAFVMQISFVHAVDMEIAHSLVVMGMTHASEHDGALCSETEHSKAKGCFAEIGESKWIENVREFEFAPIFFASLLLFLGMLASQIIPGSLGAFFRPRILYHPTLYLGLYGIIRNVN